MPNVEVRGSARGGWIEKSKGPGSHLEHQQLNEPCALPSCILLHLLLSQIEFAKSWHFGRVELLIRGRWRGDGVSWWIHSALSGIGLYSEFLDSGFRRNDGVWEGAGCLGDRYCLMRQPSPAPKKRQPGRRRTTRGSGVGGALWLRESVRRACRRWPGRGRRIRCRPCCPAGAGRSLRLSVRTVRRAGS